jgi:DNA repair protein RecN (Recombination protein N)
VLEEIGLHQLGVIEDAVLELVPGLTVLTGETGAGKTMVLTGLHLLLGGRPDPALVRKGAARALVEGRVLLPAEADVTRRIREAGADLDEGALLLARTISAEGRSRAYAGGRSVPATLLADLGQDLVAVHGQSDQRGLLRPARQRAALDRFAGAELARPLAAYAAAYTRLRAVAAQLEEVGTRARERAREADLLRFGLAEVEAVAPVPGEDVALAAEAERLRHADALRAAALTAHVALRGDPDGPDDPDATSLVGAARRSLDSNREHDAELAALADRLAELSYLFADVAADVAAYAAGVDADPLRLAAVEERRAALARLTRKYGADIAEVLAWAQRAALQLTDLDGDDERLGRLRAEETALRAELGRQAAALTRIRQAAAQRLAATIGGELADLAMPHARVRIAVTQTDDSAGLTLGGRRLAYGPTGIDDVEILLAAHRGAPERPLARCASGGELSRVMLAVEVAMAGADPVPTLVFDEVDAGVGGKVAVEVGRRLARLARSAQVIVVTHLPQVAAFADRHLAVVRSEQGSVTSSGVRVLDDPGRVVELSRMLAGLEGSRLGRAHAEELLEVARSGRD